MSRPIRSGVLAMIAALLPLMAHAQKEEVFNAHFEISLNDKTVRANPHMRSAQNLKVNFENNLATLAIERISNSEYELTMVVFVGKDESNRDSILLSRNFRGTFGVPLEINGRADGLWMTGAISVTVLEE